MRKTAAKKAKTLSRQASAHSRTIRVTATPLDAGGGAGDAAIKLSKDKRIAKDVRRALSVPRPPKNPYAALMQPMVIVPDNAAEKPVIADAGSIIKLADQHTFYRDRTSPVTRGADEILVHYGNPKKPSLGWITERLGSKAMKPSKGPTFLVNTKLETALNVWDVLRLKMARTRHTKAPGTWIGLWLIAHASKYPKELRAAVRFFGGKTFTRDTSADRVQRLLKCIINTEFDMASVKKSKGKKVKTRAEKEPRGKKSASKKPAKKTKLSDSTRITAKFDEHVIRRLVKENPRRAGSEKAKVWDKLKKGMTVGEFVKKGGARSVVAFYIKNGWAKLLKPASAE